MIIKNPLFHLLAALYFIFGAHGAQAFQWERQTPTNLEIDGYRQ